MTRLTESRAVRAKLPQSGQQFMWCSEIAGFGVRLTPGSRSWIIQCRVHDKSIRLTLGHVGTLPFEGPPRSPGTRDLALAALNGARRGENPRVIIGRARQPSGITLKEVWAAYEEAGFPKLKRQGKKRETTIRSDRLRYGLYLENSLAGRRLARSMIFGRSDGSTPSRPTASARTRLRS
jgi:hypothetical protein